MKRIIYRAEFILLAVFIGSATLAAQEVSKEFHKQYTAGPNTTLDISNKYGDVVVETNNQDQITIDVKVVVELPNRSKAETLLSYIDVQFSEEGDVFKAKTVINDKFNFSGWGSGSRRFRIDYRIKMPEKINFYLANRYGNSDLDDIAGLVRLDIKYGNLTGRNFSRGNEKPLSFINLAYGKADIESIGWLDATVRYAGTFSINKAQALLLDSKYSKVQVDEISSVVGETKYDNIRIGKANNVVLDAGYSDININEIYKKLKFDGGYGSFTVDRVPSGFESIESDTKYIGVKIAIDGSASYQLDAKVSYGDLKFDENNFQHQRRVVENTSSETSGIVGKESSPSSKVTINASYGSVRLY